MFSGDCALRIEGKNIKAVQIKITQQKVILFANIMGLYLVIVWSKTF